MTIIQPNSKFNRFYVALLTLVLLIGAGFYIYEYNRLVSLNHQIKNLEIDILSFENKDSDLRNRFYSLINLENLEELAAQYGLILEKKPEYLNLRSDFKDLSRK